MTKFHEGQEVVVNQWANARSGWSNAKIASNHGPYPLRKGREMVEFPDGTRAVFDADHIRHTLYDLRNDGAVFAEPQWK